MALSAPATMSLLSFLLLLVTNMDLSTAEVAKGSVSCLDCAPRYDLSGVKVGVHCSNTNELASARTNYKGYFEVQVPASASSTPPKCVATLLGGPVQLCAYKKSMVSELVKPRGSETYTLSSSLNFFTTCPARVEGTINAGDEKASDDSHGSSSSPSTPDNVPQPYPWGLPPPSYFYRFLPIIGIP